MQGQTHEKPWSRLYKTSHWLRLRAQVLRRQPICVVCNRNPSEVCDHIQDHRGDEALFYAERNVRGVCESCHDQRTSTEHGSGDRRSDAPLDAHGRIREQSSYAPKASDRLAATVPKT